VKPPDIDSAAFRDAVFRSERLRLRGLLAVLAVALALVLVRAAVVADPAERRLALVIAGILGAAVAFEVVALRALDRTLAGAGAGTRAPLPMVVGPVVETLAPTLMLLATAHAENAGPLRALAGPVVVVYFLLIMLSILRLTPALSLFAGVASAAGYAAVWVLGVAPAAAGARNAPLATGVFATEVVLMVIAGALAAAVAVRVRAHVVAALREAEARSSATRASSTSRGRSSRGCCPPPPPPSTASTSPGGTARPTRPAATTSTSSTPAAAPSWW